MTGQTTRISRGRTKTWSSFGNLGRKPSEYEIVTHKMNHTFGHDGPPLEMGPDVHGNVWLREHRDEHLFGVVDWDAFRDPDAMTYRKYCHIQDEQETYVDGLLRDFTQIKQADRGLSAAALQFLQLAMTPCRYLGHIEQMLSAYIQQLSPSSYVANCASFQTADILRRVQRVAYRTKQLDNAHPMFGFGSSERGIWEADPDWQPIRRALELLLVKYDFDRAFVGFQIVMKPIVDGLFLKEFAGVARSLGAEVDALIADNLHIDSQRGNRWTAALARFVQEKNPSGRETLRDLIAEHAAMAEEAIDAGARLLARQSTSAYATRETDPSATASPADLIQFRVRSDWRILINEAGLGADA
jgi:Methane/Phenol/Toluene Hydroxylase